VPYVLPVAKVESDLARIAVYRILHDIGDEREPELEWELKVGEGHIEATPAAWNGMIYVGTRDGYMYAVGE
jgi:outer membrane protein assembly factor BamB